jgi:hypothetical protein
MIPSSSVGVLDHTVNAFVGPRKIEKNGSLKNAQNDEIVNVAARFD